MSAITITISRLLVIVMLAAMVGIGIGAFGMIPSLSGKLTR
jgi:hypothetical protein